MLRSHHTKLNWLELACNRRNNSCYDGCGDVYGRAQGLAAPLTLIPTLFLTLILSRSHIQLCQLLHWLRQTRLRNMVTPRAVLSVMPNSVMLHGYATCLCHVWSCQLRQIRLRHMVMLHTELRHSASLIAPLPRHSTASLLASLPRVTRRHPPSATASPTVTRRHSHRHPHRHPPSATASPTVTHRYSLICLLT